MPVKLKSLGLKLWMFFVDQSGENLKRQRKADDAQIPRYSEMMIFREYMVGCNSSLGHH